jgi:hypothetical protein
LPESEAPASKRWLTRENLVAAATVVVGGASGLAGGLLVSMAPDNYGHKGFLDGLVTALAAAVALFATGAYATAAVPWALDAREKDYSPALVAFGAFVGVSVGMSLFGWLNMVLFGGVAQLLAVASGYGLARLACEVRVGKPRRAAFRWARVFGMAFVGFCAAVGTTPQTDFPGADAPIAERRAWAVKTFNGSYDKIEAYLQHSREVRERLGTIEAMGPTEGLNRTATSPGELMGEFTIEVKGAKGTGVAHLQFMHGSSSPDWQSYGIHGELRGPVDTVQLPEAKEK